MNETTVKKDLIMKTNIRTENGLLKVQETELAINLLQIQPNKAENGAFVFYSVKNNDYICKIGITNKRNRLEIVYETAEKYRNKGFMNIALDFVIDWIFTNTLEPCIWALINNNVISEHILLKHGFLCNGADNYGKWFVLRKKGVVI